jgi:V/A-type H+-transporting ATPase subunit D
MAMRPPPGRAGRLWLSERLATAHRGAGLLERKREALRRELSRSEERVSRTRVAWKEACDAAERWMLRALMLGCRPALELAAATTRDAHARLEWRTALGVTYPRVAMCELPEPGIAIGPAPLRPAMQAYRQALDAGVRHAAATATHERLASELAGTSHRLRAVQERWIPRLEQTLATLELHLDEAEREAIVTLRWAKHGGRA